MDTRPDRGDAVKCGHETGQGDAVIRTHCRQKTEQVTSSDKRSLEVEDKRRTGMYCDASKQTKLQNAGLEGYCDTAYRCIGHRRSGREVFYTCSLHTEDRGGEVQRCTFIERRTVEGSSRNQFWREKGVLLKTSAYKCDLGMHS